MHPLHDKQAWSQYHRAIDRARRDQLDPTDLPTAMRTAAVACGFQQQPHTDNDRPPTALGDMLHDLWHAKQQLATLLHTDTPHARECVGSCIFLFYFQKPSKGEKIFYETLQRFSK